MNEQIGITLLNQKIEILKNINEVGMIWWSTTIVFSFTIIGVIWKNKEELKKMPYSYLIRITLSSFFISVVAFGVWMIITIMNIKNEYEMILREFKVEQGFVEAFSFVGSQVAFSVGIFNFFIISCVWFVLANHVWNKS